MSEYSGRTVFVFGAAGALGSGLAEAFRGAGAQVVGFDRVEPDGAHRLDGVGYRGADVLEDGALGAAFDAEPVPWAVINVIGGFAGRRPLTEFDPAELARQLQLNLTSAALITKHALRRLGERGEGRVVHTASRVALRTEGSGFAYSVSKLGVLHLVQMAAAETHGSGITVNAVVPSIMDTPANRASMPGAAHERWPKVADVAAAYLFLASPAAQLVSGAALPVYGLT
ncbi:SDR family oxidoreductase [Jatrophihabitans cynanchi]|uniref:SDR family oxidoreductase n=1 Tax=Jatrophihabitans cynanchi TaxID=2944128 RepID=A0ABY7JZ56_9ACTN|nr:SDR family oxidoreductase [Jatrophihabitans sp. SB3-54]WAX57849.1 SDR family oxidoreductase [Jatrophihabitans sp. SB3-54]